MYLELSITPRFSEKPEACDKFASGDEKIGLPPFISKRKGPYINVVFMNIISSKVLKKGGVS